ncbi:DUF2971 domain-containing protein [Chlorobium sp. N1]|uniref:DUF2971 domain-containing protein n=1 Tax=Chlorobium sp. N1 TaxID=2491138 RepID=UPI0010386792|nr:DUF2971 domain-containing protein [Chlorobium sp. N1]TCD46887.1 DUF2971 domain-containing protein [Chlorobium sp. N1]
MHAISNLSLKRLRVSRLDQLNDPFEFLAADLLDPRDRQALTHFKAELAATKGMICFSRSWSNPLLWGHYAEKHTGMALGFDIPEGFLLRIHYSDERPRVILDPETREIINKGQAVDQLIRTKFSDWHYEDEYRMFVDLDPASQEAGNHFVDFSSELLLREVVPGLKCELPIQRIRQLLKDECPPVKVLKAGMALRKFKVIEDRTART